ncbi:uncharacterized protein LOC121406862 [Lytechinus variegatus]|uniref:uncharacterized protein LOC121406862 n=1 Tax=Lytechinus variegatus TaxID=7654 RepID=UPI001BB2BF32|nr:uncharacterized protein LOC121406862 [Lytechinus variegatus]
MCAAKSDGKPDVKPDVKSVAKQDVKLDIKPEDSVSQCGSKTSAATSTSSSSTHLRAKAMAKRAALAAAAKGLQLQQELEAEQLRLKQKQALLELQTKLEIAKAEEMIYNELYEENDDKKSQTSHTKNTTQEHTESGLDTNPQGQGKGHVKLEPNLDDTIPYPISARSPSFGQAEGQYQMPDNFQQMSQAQLNNQHHLEAISLSNADVFKFNGDPLRYFEFVRSFDNLIGRSALDNGAKLLRLFNSCEGEPKKIVQCCMIMDPAVGYHKARTLLEDRFGSRFKISQAWVRKVTSGPNLRPTDKSGLQRFSDDLKICNTTLQALGMMSEMSNQQHMMKIIERLPYYLKSRWLRVVKDIRHHGRAPNITDVVNFVSDAAEEVNDPVFGALVEVKREYPPSRQPVKQKTTTSSFTTSADDNNNKTFKRKCYLCKAEHSLFGCDTFKKMTPAERLQFAKKAGVCFNCLVKGHMTKDCYLKRTCTVDGCGRKHTKFLHIAPGKQQQSGNSQQPAQFDSQAQPDQQPLGTQSHVTGAGKLKVALPILPVRVYSSEDDFTVDTFAMLDPGSTTSFCTEDLRKRLHATGKKRTLSLSTLEHANNQLECLEISLTVQAHDTDELVTLPHVYTKKAINISCNNVSQEDISRFPHLEDLNILDSTSFVKVDLLIGQDTPEALIPLEVRRGEDGPFAIKTKLGWTLNGPLVNIDEGNTQASSSFISNDDSLETQLKLFWSMETVKGPEDARGMSVNDRRALQVWDNSVCLKEGHYELSIPFKEDPPRLPDSRPMAESRLQSLGKRLAKDERLHTKYKEGIADLLQQNFAEEVPDQEEDSNGPTWYLPHHPVFNPKKPDKTRIVFDCAAKSQGRSLNDAVMQGPDMTNKLLGVLLRFRQEPAAMMADIQAMFHQVRVPQAERDVLRFLWWPEGNLELQPKLFRMCVHLFGGTWSPSVCSYALKRTAEDHQEEYSPEAVTAVAHNFYVDDCLISCENEEKAITVAAELRNLLEKGGFKLTKWASNSSKVLTSIPEEDRAKQVKGLDLNCDTLPIERALGVEWNTELDCFSYKITPKDKPLTRRGLLSEVASVYDPYGFAGPFILYAKGLLQGLTAMKLGWDDPIPDEYRVRWQKWKAELSQMEDVKINRCYKPYDFEQVVENQLHNFCDASEKAYGVVTYLRMKNEKGEVDCNIVLAKSRLTPLKKVTLPRLELMAATLAVTMDGMIRHELDLQLKESVFWTDSAIVLHYISNEDKRFHTFVANRIAAIREGSNPKQWRHVSSDLNPADDITRGLTPRELNGRWLTGPDFLYADEEEWPRCLELQGHKLNNDPEVKQGQTQGVFSSTHSEDVIEALIRRYSSWFCLKKAVVYMLRLRSYLRWKAGHKVNFEGSQMNHPLSLSEMKKAEEAVIHYVQKTYFKTEYEYLEGMPQISKENDKSVKSKERKIRKSSSLSKLNPEMNENGLICVGGRLQYSTLNEGFKHPLILPRKHHVVELLVRHFHELTGHSGQEYVLARLRERYWIIGGRSAVKEVLRKCFVCRRQSSQPMEQKMSDLPRERITPDKPPFTNVGVDCFGPFTVKQGRKDVKRYGCIFTCLVLRAIHIEVLHAMDTDSFINGLERFISRRGRPEVIWSDNGSNFVGAERELREGIKCWNQRQIHQFLLQREITWKFNPPTASHMGGAWERQIRTVRKVLGALMMQQSLHDEGLTTLMCKVEAIVNGRPLTVVSADRRDPEPLTPNHLLLIRPNAELPPGVFDQSDLYSRRRWRQVQYLADVFWRRWTKEYLPTLQHRQKWVKERRNLDVDDVVLVVDDMPRNKWLLGRVVEIYPGKDKLVRSAKVKVVTGELTRPIHKLCLLESVESDEK